MVKMPSNRIHIDRQQFCGFLRFVSHAKLIADSNVIALHVGGK
jgi:hypothetical protein